MKDDIAFVGLVVRTTDGVTRALDLSRDDLELKVEIAVPDPPADITDFGAPSVHVAVPKRVDATVTGHRRAGAEKLFTIRLVPDGEAPFPPFDQEPS